MNEPSGNQDHSLQLLATHQFGSGSRLRLVWGLYLSSSNKYPCSSARRECALTLSERIDRCEPIPEGAHGATTSNSGSGYSGSTISHLQSHKRPAAHSLHSYDILTCTGYRGMRYIRQNTRGARQAALGHSCSVMLGIWLRKLFATRVGAVYDLQQ